MEKINMTQKASTEATVHDIHRNKRRKYSAEVKIITGNEALALGALSSPLEMELPGRYVE